MKPNSYFVDLAASLLAGLFVHPFHVAEARYILNNRLPNFNAYKSGYTYLMSIGLDFMNGISLTLPRTLLLSLTGFNYWNSANLYNYLTTQLIFQTAAYPLLTI